MRPGTDSEILDVLGAAGIRTHMLTFLDFASGGVCVWTGSHQLLVTGDSDPLINGKTFEPMVEGIPISVGVNAFSYTGSEALSLSIAIPDIPTDVMVAASADPEEYQTRTAIIWRALMIEHPTASTPAVWAFRRVRAGTMDELSISNTGSEHLFTMTIEGHQAMITNASGSNYLDQKKFDPTDTSQDYAVSIANNPNTPGKAAMGRGGGGGGGGGGSNFGDALGDPGGNKNDLWQW